MGCSNGRSGEKGQKPGVFLFFACLSLRGGLRHQVCAHDGAVSFSVSSQLQLAYAGHGTCCRSTVLATHFPRYCPNDGGTKRRPDQWDGGAAQGWQGQVKGLSSLSVGVVGG